MTNEEMKAGRFLRWHVARRKIAWIAARHAQGKTVFIRTATHIFKYPPKCSGMFKATRNGAYVQRGTKKWDCIDFNHITAA